MADESDKDRLSGYQPVEMTEEQLREAVRTYLETLKKMDEEQYGRR